jgi:uncharacterized membrane protein
VGADGRRSDDLRAGRLAGAGAVNFGRTATFSPPAVAGNIMFAAVQRLPEGFALPPLPYLVGVVTATLIVAALLAAIRPPFGSWEVLALGTWMAAGATFHALAVVEAFPEWLAPLFGAPTVYFTTFVVTGALWILALVAAEAGFLASVPRLLGVVGANVTVVFVAFTAYIGIQRDVLAFAPLWPVLGLVGAGVLAGVAFFLLSLTYTEAAATTGKTGLFVVFAHSLDGVTTAIGVDVLCEGTIRTCERSPVPRAIMEFAAGLPTAQYVGSAWLFVLVKVLLALVVVALFTDYVREDPDQANLVLAGVAAVGLGPGVYNTLLYMVSAAAV